MSATAEEHAAPGPTTRLLTRLRRWRDRRIADPAFQAWAVRFPLTRGIANRRGAALYDLVAGFVYSQVLYACVDLDLFRRLSGGPLSLVDLSARTGLDEPALERLLRAAAALDLLRPPGRRDARWALGPLGAALLGAPGVEEMVRHHPMFYRDLEDPLALLTAPKGSTELAAFWRYVDGAPDSDQAAAYSRLMASSQRMVAAETLAVCPLAGVHCLLDIGGGEGAFLRAALHATPGLRGIVFDLPPVAERAQAALAAAGLGARARAVGGSFLADPLPEGADAISLVRVLYDHDTQVVRQILSAAIRALPPGGRLILSEPMSGGLRPTRAGDAYFGLYTAAMTSGTPRSVAEHVGLLTEAGFVEAKPVKARQPFITRVITARKPAQRGSGQHS